MPGPKDNSQGNIGLNGLTAAPLRLMTLNLISLCCCSYTSSNLWILLEIIIGGER